MNKFIISIIKKILPKELPKPMGRWRVENNNKNMNLKVDLSNEDHCGPCGEYALTQIKTENINKDIIQKDIYFKT